MNKRILVIDDNHDIWRAYSDILCNTENEGPTGKRLHELLGNNPDILKEQDLSFDLVFADQGQKGYEAVRQAINDEEPLAVAFIDIRMPPGWDGMETAAKIRAIDPNLEIVIVTAYSDRSRRQIVNAVGSPEKLLFLRKPFDPEELYQLALSLCTKWNLARQQEQAARALQSSEARFRNLVETTSDWVWEVDAEGRFTYCSPVCQEMYGYRPEELVGKSIFSALFEENEGVQYLRFFERCAQNMQSFKGHVRQCRRKDGIIVSVESSGVPVIGSSGELEGFRGVDRDITERLRHENERRRLEEQFRQSQKMEAIGTLAGGIAHDLNNLLTPILGYTDICLVQAENDSLLRESLEIINKSACKAADLIRQILAFSRKQMLSSRVVELNGLVREFVKILRRLIREDINFELDLAEECWLTMVDIGQVEQILTNLIVNARDAVGKNGTIRVSVHNESVSGEEMEDIDFAPFEGDFVVLKVSDNGCGMDKETASRIFDPFFTTKDIGKGTGLGLATLYGIVKQHKGHLRLETAPGEGSVFSVYFPRCTDEEQKEQQEESMTLPGGYETILIAEDDAVVRQVTVSMLNNLGYRVIEAADGHTALEKFREGDEKIRLVIADLVMPGMGGKELVDKCRQYDPELKVIYMSGYPCEPSLQQAVNTKKVIFLEKPFKRHVLAWKIREALNGRTDAQMA